MFYTPEYPQLHNSTLLITLLVIDLLGVPPLPDQEHKLEVSSNSTCQAETLHTQVIYHFKHGYGDKLMDLFWIVPLPEPT